MYCYIERREQVIYRLAIIFLLFSFNCRNDSADHEQFIVNQGIYYLPTIYDPAKINDIVTLQIIPHIIETLVKINESGSIESCLAASWRISQNRKIYNFKLNKNIIFHDGSKLSTEDVFISFERQYNNLSEYYTDYPANIFERFFDSIIEKIEIINDEEITFYLKEPNELFLYILASPYCSGILSKKSLEHIKGEEKYLPIGTGPYFIEDNSSYNEISLRYFENYHTILNPAIKVIMFVANQQNNLEQMMVDNELDVLHRIRGNMIEKFISNEKCKIYVLKSMSTFYLGYNLDKSIFNNKISRKLINSIINKREIVTTLNRSNADIAYSPLPNALWNMEESNNNNVYDPPLGYLEGDSLIIIGYAPDDRVRLFYHAIVKSIEELGLKIEEKYYKEWDNFFQDRESRIFHLFFSTWYSDFVGDPYFFLYSLFHSESTNNYFHYRNAAVDSLLDRARVTERREDRNACYQGILNIIEEDVPGVFIHHPKEVFVVNKRFSPIIIDPYGYIHFEKIQTY